MPLAPSYLGSQVAALARQGYPSDGSKKLPPRLERLCGLLAAGDCSYSQAAHSLRVSKTTVYRVTTHPVFRARIAHLRDALAQSAYEATPLVDKRNRVVMAATLAETLHRQGQAADWRETVAVTKQGEAITGFDWRRTDQLRQLLDYLAKEVGDRVGSGGSAQQQSVAVSLSVDDAVLRVQALFSRVEGGGTPPEGVAGGGLVGDAGTTTARSVSEYENTSHAGESDGEAIEADYTTDDDATDG